MDDMTRLEQRMADDALSVGGPSRPVDVDAVFTAITATPSPKWRFQSMFSAAKLVVAGAIVALFGGFLLAGVLTQPSEESMPAVGVSASASAELADTMASSEFSLQITGYPSGDRYPQNSSVDPDTGLRTVTGMSFEAVDPDVSRDWSTVGPPIIGPEGVDPRALGSVTEVWAESPELISAEWRNGLMVERRTTRVENDGGVWVGTATLPSIGFGVVYGTAMWELVGEDGYEGLTMFLWGEYKHHPDVLVGIIVPSDSVPDFPPPPDPGTG